MVDFPRGLVHHYQKPHAPWTLSIHQIHYFNLPLYPRHHTHLFPYQIHLFSFLIISPLKIRLLEYSEQEDKNMIIKDWIS